jgi:hypothetical protein
VFTDITSPLLNYYRRRKILVEVGAGQLSECLTVEI